MKMTNFILRWGKEFLSPKYPLHIFHHIPKCGGKSVLNILNKWFVVIEDYRRGGEYKQCIDLSRVKSIHCLCGHFELEGYHLFERYPEVLDVKNLKLFTFLRDPLQVKLSLYRYEKMNNRSDRSLEEHLLTRTNYISSIFPVTIDNYETVLDRYFFIGLVEDAQMSMDYLAFLLGKPRQSLPWINKTSNEGLSTDNIPLKLVEQFRRENYLDYALYEYALRKYKKRISTYL